MKPGNCFVIELTGEDEIVDAQSLAIALRRRLRRVLNGSTSSEGNM